MLKKITQSFIKDMREYLEPVSSLCGHFMRYKWIEGKLLEGSKEMKLGSYVEFKVTGALPKDKREPFPERTQSGKLTADYERAIENIKRIIMYFESMGFVQIQAGRTLHSGRFSGTIDVIMRATRTIKFDTGVVIKKDEEIIIDMKYSGMINERWNKHGWVWTDEQKKYHGTQAIQYHYIGKRRFFFLVCSSKNTTDLKFFEVDVTDRDTTLHIDEANDLFGHFEIISQKGFEPRPSVSMCTDCILRNGCKDRHDYPHPILITL